MNRKCPWLILSISITFHTFVVEDSQLEQNRVRARLYNCHAGVCKATLRLALRAPLVVRNYCIISEEKM